MVPAWLVAIPGLLFLYLGNMKDRGGVMFSGVLWLLYGFYEHHVQATCTGECNIRVDLLLIYPVLAIATIGSIVSLARPEPRRGKKHRKKGDSGGGESD